MWQAQESHFTSQGTGWLEMVGGGQITFTSEWLADIQPEPAKTPKGYFPSLCGHGLCG